MGPIRRCLLLVLPATLAVGADAPPAPDPASATGRIWTDAPPIEPPQPAVVSPVRVQRAIQDAARLERGLWDDFDLDHDGTVSQLEVVACIAKRPRWLRTRFPVLFAAIDTDHDGAISFAELQAFAERATPQLFTLSQRQTAMVGPDPTGVFGAGGAGGGGAGVEIGSGGVTASAAFMHQQAYVAGYDVVGGQYQPVIGVLGYGTVLNVGDVVITIVHHGP